MRVWSPPTPRRSLLKVFALHTAVTRFGLPTQVSSVSNSAASERCWRRASHTLATALLPASGPRESSQPVLQLSDFLYDAEEHPAKAISARKLEQLQQPSAFAPSSVSSSDSSAFGGKRGTSSASGSHPATPESSLGEPCSTRAPTTQPNSPRSTADESANSFAAAIDQDLGMTVPWTSPEAGLWRSGYGQGPFTVDAGGGVGIEIPVAERAFVGSLPTQPHPAFAASRAARPFIPTTKTPGPQRAAPVTMEHAFAPSRSSRNSRQNSGSSMNSPVNASFSSASNIGKPYARPAAKAPPSTSLWASTPGVALPLPHQPIAGPSRPPKSPTKSFQPAPSFDFEGFERDLRKAPVEAKSPPAVKLAHSILSTSTVPARAKDDVETPEEMAANDPLAMQLWKFFAKAKKSSMPHASRMENLAWRVGGLKLAEINAGKAVEAEEPDRGRRSRSAEAVPAETLDEMDWRAKSRSRSRAAERIFEGMDWRGSSRSRSRVRVGDMRWPGAGEAAAPVLSLDAWTFDHTQPTIPEQQEPVFGNSAQEAHVDEQLSRLLGLDSYTSTALPGSSGVSSDASSLKTVHQPSRAAERAKSPQRSYDDTARKRALGSMVGVTGEASLPINQDATYGFLPRLVRKTSYDGASRPAHAEAAAAAAPVSPVQLPTDSSYVDPSLWARLLDPHGHAHEVLPPPPQLIGLPPALYAAGIAPHIIPGAVNGQPGLVYPYAYNLASRMHPVAATGLPPLDTTASAPSSVPPSPFRTSYGFDPSTFAQAASFVNPSMVLKSNPPTAAPSPTALAATTTTGDSPGWSVGSSSSLSNQPSPAEDASGRSRQNTGNAPSISATGEALQCTNCKTSNTPLWRRDESGRPLCNGCGLFRKLHGVDRPLSLATGIVKKRNRNRTKDTGKKTNASSRTVRRSSVSN